MGATRTGSTPTRRRLALLAAVVVLLGAGPQDGAGQVAPAALGVAGGLAAGLYTTASVYVVEARFGRYVYSVGEVLSPNAELLPVAAGLVGGTWLGVRSGSALARAGLWGGLGLLGGAALGAGAGRILWDSGENRWAATVVGGAAGLVTGAVLGGLSGLDEDDDGAARPMSVSVSVPIGRR